MDSEVMLADRLGEIQNSLSTLSSQFAEFRGSVMQRMTSIDERFKTLNGSVESQGKAIRAVEDSRRDEAAAADHEEIRITERRSSEESKEPSERSWLFALVRSLGTIPPVVWRFLFALWGGLVLLFGLMIMTGQLERLQPLIKTWAENRKPDIIIQKPEPVTSASPK